MTNDLEYMQGPECFKASQFLDDPAVMQGTKSASWVESVDVPSHQPECDLPQQGTENRSSHHMIIN